MRTNCVTLNCFGERRHLQCFHQRGVFRTVRSDCGERRNEPERNGHGVHNLQQWTANTLTFVAGSEKLFFERGVMAFHSQFSRQGVLAEHSIDLSGPIVGQGRQGLNDYKPVSKDPGTYSVVC
jgi:hypothetical protein